jgi:hypothetical protein
MFAALDVNPVLVRRVFQCLGMTIQTSTQFQSVKCRKWAYWCRGWCGRKAACSLGCGWKFEHVSGNHVRWILKVRILVGLEGCSCHLMENQKQRSTEDLFVWFCGPFLCFALYVHACKSWWLISDSELKGGTAFCRRIFLTILQLCCTDCIQKSSSIKESVFSTCRPP